MIGLSLLLATSMAQVPNPQPAPASCVAALATGSASPAGQVCLGDQELALAGATTKPDPEWSAHLASAIDHFRRGIALASDSDLIAQALERLASIYDTPMLNEPQEMEMVLRDLIRADPSGVKPLFRLAKTQEEQGAIDAAEETLLSARRLQPAAVEPWKMLAQFYARRVGALSSEATKTERQGDPQTPSTPDKNGVYSVGDSVKAPRRFGNAPYPPEAMAAGIQGSVVAEVVVDEAGVVTAARVLRSVPLLDDAALKAVREWRYDPTLVNGNAVPVRMTVTVNFSLKQ